VKHASFSWINQTCRRGQPEWKGLYRVGLTFGTLAELSGIQQRMLFREFNPSRW
jgi:hypothetical protein